MKKMSQGHFLTYSCPALFFLTYFLGRGDPCQTNKLFFCFACETRLFHSSSTVVCGTVLCTRFCFRDAFIANENLLYHVCV